MYHLLNAHIDDVLERIDQVQGHVTEYDWLIKNLGRGADPQYQARYRRYWRMDLARLSAHFCDAYFRELQAAQLDLPAVGCLAQRLYDAPTYGSGRRSLQFFFATKLVHTVAPATPIYDSLVAAFYFYEAPAYGLPLVDRVKGLEAFHAFLGQEYQRVLGNNLLATAIERFRQRFNPQHFTDVKVIDSLLWAYTALLRAGHVGNGRLRYC